MFDLTTFDFEETAVRVVMRDDEPWFVAADVCRVLDISNTSQAVQRLDEDETVTLFSNEGYSGGRQLNIISESGLYALVLTSRKPEAKRFRKWITTEVIPSLRKTGVYAIEKDKPHDLHPDADIWRGLIREARMLYGKPAAIDLWRQSPLPQIATLMEAAAVGNAKDQDLVSAFLRDCCVATGVTSDRMTFRVLFNRFEEWMTATGQDHWGDNRFGRTMTLVAEHYSDPHTLLGFSRKKSAGIWYVGLRFRMSEDVSSKKSLAQLSSS